MGSVPDLHPLEMPAGTEHGTGADGQNAGVLAAAHRQRSARAYSGRNLVHGHFV
jgi:hypothetical protein